MPTHNAVAGMGLQTLFQSPLRNRYDRPAFLVSIDISSRVGRVKSATGKACIMSIIGWIVLGLIAGFIASKIVNKSGSGILLDIVLGVVGAVVGGFLFNTFGAAGVTGFNIYSMVVAVIGAVVVLFVYHLISGRRAL